MAAFISQLRLGFLNFSPSNELRFTLAALFFRRAAANTPRAHSSVLTDNYGIRPSEEPIRRPNYEDKGPLRLQLATSACKDH